MVPQPFFFFVGKIASGKETQGRLLAEALGFEMFSTGAQFRAMLASETDLGKRVKEVYEQGLLMPAWFANYLFQQFVLNLPPDKGAVFEGSGRDVDQAKMIEEVSVWLKRPYAVLNLQVSDETVLKRSLARARDAVDSEATVKTRLAEYARLTEPAIAHFRTLGRVIDINGENTPEVVDKEVSVAIAEFNKK